MTTDYRIPNYDAYFAEDGLDARNDDHEEQCVCECCCAQLDEGEETFARIEDCSSCCGSGSGDRLDVDLYDACGACGGEGSGARIWVCFDCSTPEERRASDEAKSAARDKNRAEAHALWEASGAFIDDDLPF